MDSADRELAQRWRSYPHPTASPGLPLCEPGKRMPRAIVVLNPRSRSGARAPIARMLDAFAASGWTAEIWVGDGPDWAHEAALRARDTGVDAIFGAGGDGLLAR